MVGPFGGATAAAILRAIEMQPDRFGEPVALTVNFAAPIATGEFHIGTQAVRSNRTNQHWTASLSQGEDVKSTATAVFAERRGTWSDTELVMPRVEPPEAVPPTAGPEGFATFLQNYDMRFVSGPPTLTDNPRSDSVSTLWVRHKPNRHLDFPALAALADIFYPRVFLRRGGPVPAGTVSMTTYFHVGGVDLADYGTDFVLATARGQQFTRGYFDQAAHLWSRDGVLLATTNQIVYYRDSLGD
jgi:acyl-CoA thioesterase